MALKKYSRVLILFSLLFTMDISIFADKSEPYNISRLVLYGNNVDNSLEVLKEEITIKFTGIETYDVINSYAIKNNGPSQTLKAGIAMYTFYGEISVAPGINFRVNNKEITYSVLLDQHLEYKGPDEITIENNRIYFLPINWAFVEVDFAANSTTFITVQYSNNLDRRMQECYAFINTEHQNIGYTNIEGEPEYILHIENNSIIDKPYESIWINDIVFTKKDNPDSFHLYQYLMRAEDVLDTRQFLLQKNNKNTWTIVFTSKFIAHYGRVIKFNIAISTALYVEGDSIVFPFYSDLVPEKCIINKRLLAPHEFFFFSEKQLWIIRNLFYAQYGYPFENKELEAIFYYDNFGVFGPLHPNPNFSDSMLTEIDRVNIETLRGLETLSKN